MSTKTGIKEKRKKKYINTNTLMIIKKKERVQLRMEIQINWKEALMPGFCVS